MRIISQDRVCDIPYETSVIEISEEGFMRARFANGNTLLGGYKTSIKAKEVLADIRNAYLYGVKVYKLPPANQVKGKWK